MADWLLIGFQYFIFTFSMRDVTLDIDNVTFCSLFYTIYVSLSRSFLFVYLCEIRKVNVTRN
jgi:hypothetical protein